MAARRVELLVDLQSRVMDAWNERRLGETLERAVRNGNPIRMEHWKRPLQEGTVARIYLGQAFAGIGQAQEGRIRFRCMLLRGGSPQ